MQAGKGSHRELSVILRCPAFVALWLSETFSLIGDRLMMVALIALVYDCTGSAGAVGLLMLVKALPALLLGSLAGVFVDRWNRKWIMVISNLLQGLLVFWMPLATDITVIFILYLVMSMINQFFVPARTAVIPDLFPPQALLTANSLFALSIVFGMAVGPAAAAWIMENLSTEAAFFIRTADFLLPAVVVAFLSIPRQHAASPGVDFFADLREGFTFARSHPPVLAALTTIAASFFVVGTMSVAGVVVIHTILHLESSKFGLLISAMGLEMLCSALVLNVARKRMDSVQCGAVGMALMGAGILALPRTESLPPASLFAAIIGMEIITVQINGQMLLQTISPGMRGRLLGFSQTLTGTATFLASARVGLVVEYMDVVMVMRTIGIITMITGQSVFFTFGRILL
ncbi:MAG: MFS transporter [Leptolinea sp.]|nr:MFS transporter [Leptolinea sp.]